MTDVNVFNKAASGFALPAADGPEGDRIKGFPPNISPMIDDEASDSIKLLFSASSFVAFNADTFLFGRDPEPAFCEASVPPVKVVDPPPTFLLFRTVLATLPDVDDDEDDFFFFDGGGRALRPLSAACIASSVCKGL